MLLHYHAGTHLLSHQRFLYGGQVLQGRQEDVAPFRTPNIFNEPSKLFAQRREDFIFVFNRF